VERGAARSVVWFAGGGIIVLGLVAGFWALTYDVREFHGDGSIGDSGFWHYPRYHVVFHPIPLDRTGAFEFRMSGLPSEEMTFGLQVVGSGDYKRLAALSTQVDVEVLSEHGSIARTSDCLRDWRLAWPSGGSGYYWHVRLRNVQFRRHEEYRIRIRVSDVDPAIPSLQAVPMWEGGGTELP